MHNASINFFLIHKLNIYYSSLLQGGMAPVLRHCPCLRPENDDIRLLDYSHSNLEDVPNEVFGFERTLEELFLDANQIKDLPRVTV